MVGWKTKIQRVMWSKHSCWTANFHPKHWEVHYHTLSEMECLLKIRLDNVVSVHQSSEVASSTNYIPVQSLRISIKSTQLSIVLLNHLLRHLSNVLTMKTWRTLPAQEMTGKYWKECCRWNSTTKQFLSQQNFWDHAFRTLEQCLEPMDFWIFTSIQNINGPSNWLGTDQTLMNICKDLIPMEYTGILRKISGQS